MLVSWFPRLHTYAWLIVFAPLACKATEPATSNPAPSVQETKSGQPRWVGADAPEEKADSPSERTRAARGGNALPPLDLTEFAVGANLRFFRFWDLDAAISLDRVKATETVGIEPRRSGAPHDGWPTLREDEEAYFHFQTGPTTRLRVTWAGTPPRDLAVTVEEGQARIVERTKKYAIAEVPHSTIAVLRYRGRGVKDIRIVPADQWSRYQSGIFTDRVVSRRLAPFSVFRTMQFSEINESEATRTWSTRTLPTARSQSSERGMSWETQCKIANEVHRHWWLNVHHTVSADYVRSLAQLLKSCLAPDIQVLFEYGNEVWNSGLPFNIGQAYMVAQGEAMRLEATDYLPTWDDETDAGARGRMYHAIMTAKYGRIFREVLGDDRVHVILGGFVADNYHTRLATAAALKVGRIDALAVAPYFGPEVDDVSVNVLIGSAPDPRIERMIERSLDETLAGIDISKSVADEFRVPLIAYEGGSHLDPPGDAHDSKARALRQAGRLNRSKKMGVWYRKLLDHWKRVGGGLFVHYALAHQQDQWNGAWGIYENYYPSTRPLAKSGPVLSASKTQGWPAPR